jgi:riboflavin biosynthesis pyrimidine reductase
MAAPVHDARSTPPIVFKRLLPAGEPATAREIIEELALAWTPAAGERDAARAPLTRSQPSRPHLVLNMVSTLDGHATLEGRSGPIGNRADRELFHALRAGVDAVMVGAGTARVERYRRLIREESTHRLREERGLEPEPLACIVSGRLELPSDLPLLTDPAVRVVVLTPSAASLPASGDEGGASERAHVEYIRAARDGRLDLAAAMTELQERFAVRTVLCEGGPHLNAGLLSAGLVDELFLSLSPKLAGGDPSGQALRIVSGAGFDSPVELELLGVLEQDSHLFLRYRVTHTSRGGAV